MILPLVTFFLATRNFFINGIHSKPQAAHKGRPEYRADHEGDGNGRRDEDAQSAGSRAQFAPVRVCRA